MAFSSAEYGLRPKQVKLLLLGDSDVGKSSLLSRFTSGEFRIANNIGDRDVYIDGDVVKAQIVEIVDSVGFSFQMKNAAGALVIYDVTRHSTFDECKMWYWALRGMNEELEIMLIGNKTDLLTDSITTPLEAGKDFAESESLTFIETSAKEDRNVEKAFAELVTKIFRKTIKNDTTDASAFPAISSQAQMSRSGVENEPAHYMLKIECFSFLSEAGTYRIESGVFEAGGYKWRLELYPNRSEKEYISAYLTMCDTETLPKGWEVWTDARIFVYDHLRQNYIIFRAVDHKRTRFHKMQRQWGFSKLMSLDSFIDAGNGFVSHDSCVFGAEVFVVPKYAKKDQCLSMIKPPPNMNTHTWKIDYFSSLTEDALYSDFFKVGKVKWKLVLYPKGASTRKDTHLSIFLKVHDSELLPTGWRVYAKYEIRVMNNDYGCADRVIGCERWFMSARGWGSSCLMSLSELHNVDKGFLYDDLLTVQVQFAAVGLLKDFN